MLINDRLELGRGITTPEQFQPENHWKKTVYLFFGKPVRQCTGLGAMIAMRWNGNQVICW